jgi:hypothetical protein
MTPIMSLSLWLLLGGAGPAVIPATPLDPGHAFVEANNRYDAGDYATAAGLLEKLVLMGVQNGHVYYNLGNSQLRAGRIGKAIAAYIAARGLAPRDSDVRANLEFARKLTKDALTPASANPVVRTLFFWHYSLSQRELLWILVLVNLGLFATIGALTYRRDSEILRWLVAGLLLLVVAVGASTAIRSVAPTRVAVVVEREVDVHSGTHRDTVVRFKLHEGTEATVTDTQPGWVRLELPDDKQGWVAADEVALVEW